MTRSTTSVVFAAVFLALAAVDEAASGEIAGKGLKTGLNSSSMAGAGAEPGLTSQNGGAAGVFVTLGLTDHVAVQPEILYTQKGAELEAGTNPFEYRFSYVEVPLLWKLTFAGRDAAFRPHLYAGPFAGVKVGAQLETYRDRGQEESDEVNLPSARGIDAGVAAGVEARSQRWSGPHSDRRALRTELGQCDDDRHESQAPCRLRALGLRLPLTTRL